MESSIESARRAGAVFRQRVEADPELQARWKALGERLASVAEYWDEAAPELERARADWRDEFGVDFPSDLKGWIKLATRAGVPFEPVQASSPDDLLPWIEGYLQRLIDQEGLRRIETAKQLNSPAISVDKADKSNADEESSPKVVRSLEEVGADFRDGGLIDGEPLTVAVVAKPQKYGLSGVYLSKNYRGPLLKYGQKLIYRHKEIAALSDTKLRRAERSEA